MRSRHLKRRVLTLAQEPNVKCTKTDHPPTEEDSGPGRPENLPESDVMQDGRYLLWLMIECCSSKPSISARSTAKSHNEIEGELYLNPEYSTRSVKTGEIVTGKNLK